MTDHYDEARVGCITEKAFDLKQATEDDLLRPSYPPLVADDGVLETLRIPIDKDHFISSCNERKRKRCPLRMAHRYLMEERSEMGFALHDMIVQGYQAWFIENWIQGVARIAEQAFRSFTRVHMANDWTQIKQAVTVLKHMQKDAVETHEGFRTLVTGVKHMLEEEDGKSEFAKRWSERMHTGYNMIHDLNNIYVVTSTHIGLLAPPEAERNYEETVEMLDELRELNPQRLDTLIEMIIRLNKLNAQDKGVTLTARQIPRIEIAASARLDLFRILNELIFNAIKYRHPSEDVQSYVMIRAKANEAGRINFQVKDNGVGIKSLKSVLEYKVRERPDLATGEGRGLASIKRIIERRGWSLDIASTVNTGTTVFFGIRSSDVDQLAASSSPSMDYKNSDPVYTSSAPPRSGIITIPAPAPLPRDLCKCDPANPFKSFGAVNPHEKTLAPIDTSAFLLLSIPMAKIA